MHCEVCGRQIVGKPYKAVIEGAKMVVCSDCAKLGSAYWEEKPQRRVKRTAKPLLRISVSEKKQPPALAEALELVDDFSLRIRRAREGMELSHEDLGRKIGEKVSVLRKIESGKMTPDHRLAEKLQHALRVELLVPPSEPKAPSAALFQPREITLGEVVRLKERKTEVTKERKQ
ncbi:MAG: transcription factor [Candidatus Bathyarchaeota archaeon BA2]|nr:MAG: transcription factor [Candidatus Bathyarchaeota archaeon BA2]